MSNPQLHVVIGAGVLGQAVAGQLLQEGARVRLVSRSGATDGLSGVEPFAADLMQTDQARKACAGAAVVYQCAAPAYQNWEKEFPTLQENVLRGAAQAGAVLVAAENLYGYGVAGTLTEELPMTAATRKGRTRAALSKRLFKAHARGEVRAVAGRASDFFGPGVRMSVFGKRLWPKLLAAKPVDWFGNPDLLHSMTYVPDFARALVRLGREEQAWGQAWHAPSPVAKTPREVLALAAQLAGLPAPKIRITPKWVLRAVGLVVRAAGETVEMSYSYDAPFVIDDGKWLRTFGDGPTDWEAALRTTLAAWTATGTARAA